MSEQRFDFRAKDKLRGSVAIVERLFAQAVAREKKCLVAGIPNSHREHAIGLAYAIGAMLFIQMQQRFNIAVGAKSMSLGFQFTTQLPVVVDFAVANNPDGAVFVGHRLPSAC